MKGKDKPKPDQGKGNHTKVNLVCPDCQAGPDRATLSLYWVEGDNCFRCAICGYRDNRFGE